MRVEEANARKQFQGWERELADTRFPRGSRDRVPKSRKYIYRVEDEAYCAYYTMKQTSKRESSLAAPPITKNGTQTKELAAL
jgi:hypothetical protein